MSTMRHRPTPPSATRARLTLEPLERRFCPAAGSTLRVLAAASDYNLQVNSYERVAVLTLGAAEYARWAVGTQGGADTQAMARRVYGSLADKFDFLFFVNNEEQIRQDAEYFGLHTPVRNDTQGLGAPPFDSSSQFGSAGRLQGVIHLTERDGLRGGPSLHEVLHRWANALSEVDGGLPSHWGFSGVGGQLGGFQAGTVRALGNGLFDADGPAGRTSFGTFANGGNSIPYSPLELYLMGLVGPEAVGPIEVAENAEFTDPANGIFRATGIRTVTIQDIVRTEGARVPAAADSPRTFRAAVVVLTPTPLTQESLDRYDTDVELFERAGDNGDPFLFNFWEATGGRAELQLGGLSSGVQFSTTTFRAAEGGDATITVVRTGDAAGTATVDYRAEAGSATVDADFTSVRGTLSFAAGEASRTFTVALLDDGTVEGDETITLTLSNANGATLGAPAAATLTIAASDQPLTPTEQFISDAYPILLGQPVDGPGLAYWTDFLLRNAVNGRETFAQILQGTEAGRRVQLNRLYRQYIDRDVDEGGRVFWSSLIDQGRVNLDQVGGFVISSQEFLQRVGGTATAFADQVLLRATGRPRNASDPALADSLLDTTLIDIDLNGRIDAADAGFTLGQLARFRYALSVNGGDGGGRVPDADRSAVDGYYRLAGVAVDTDRDRFVGILQGLTFYPLDDDVVLAMILAKRPAG